MIDGRIGVVIGQRGQGKTLLSFSLFTEFNNLSFYISPFSPPYDYPNMIICRSLREFLDNSLNCGKYYFTFKTGLEYHTLFYNLSQLSNINIIIDESSLWVSQWNVEESISNMVRFGRASNINLLFIAQRPQLLNPLLMSQSDYLITFNIHNVNDLEYLKKSYGFSREDISRIYNLPYLNFLIFGNYRTLKVL